MNRRSFLRGLIGGVATAAAVRTFPFRVYSFPTVIDTDSTRFMFEFEKMIKRIPDLHAADFGRGTSLVVPDPEIPFFVYPTIKISIEEAKRRYPGFVMPQRGY